MGLDIDSICSSVDPTIFAPPTLIFDLMINIIENASYMCTYIYIVTYAG